MSLTSLWFKATSHKPDVFTVIFSGTEPDVKAVIQVPPSESVRSVTMHCSVPSGSENTTCPRAHSVCWFQSGPDESFPSVFAVHEGGLPGCEDGVKGHASQKSDSKVLEEMGSSDTGTFSCVVATCGEVFFGNLSFGHAGIADQTSIFVVLLAVALAASVIVNACLVYILKRKSTGCCEGKFLFKEFKHIKYIPLYFGSFLVESKVNLYQLKYLLKQLFLFYILSIQLLLSAAPVTRTLSR